MPSCVFRFLRGAIAVEARRRRAASARIYIYIYVCMYIYICQDGGAVGFVEFTKLLFALSSLAQPLKRVRSIP